MRNFSFKSFKGPRTVWPNTNSNGLKPRYSCTDSLTAKSKRCMPSSQSFSVPKQYDFIIFSRSNEIVQGHLDFQDDMLMTYIV